MSHRDQHSLQTHLKNDLPHQINTRTKCEKLCVDFSTPPTSYVFMCIKVADGNGGGQVKTSI